jgi:hypothetical protein
MKNNNIEISIRVIWILLTANLIFTIGTILSFANNWGFLQLLLAGSFIFLFSAWLIIFNDMIRHQIHKKLHWIIIMFLMPFVAIIFYLLSRDKLIHLGQK